MSFFKRMVAAVSLAILAVPAGRAQQGTVERGVSAARTAFNGIYIVQMIDAPVVAYSGGIAGLNATRPAPGQKMGSDRPHSDSSRGPTIPAVSARIS